MVAFPKRSVDVLPVLRSELRYIRSRGCKCDPLLPSKKCEVCTVVSDVLLRNPVQHGGEDA